MNINQNATISNTRKGASPPNFCSRNKVIRDADKVARLARREFPMISDTLIYENGIKSPGHVKVYKFVSGVISEVRGFLAQEKSVAKSLLVMMDSVKQLKIGNCNESANITAIGLRANGYKDAKMYQLFAYNPKTAVAKDLGHAVVGIGLEKSPKIVPTNIKVPFYVGGRRGIIVDNWLGKVDYERNFNYKKHQFFENNVKSDEIICYTRNGRANDLSDKDILFMEKKYPGLLKSGKLSFINRIKAMFIKDKNYEFKPFEQDVIESYRTNLEFKRSYTREQLTEFLTRKARSHND